MQKGTKSGSSVDIVKKIEEYYIYNDKGLVVQLWNISRNKNIW